MFAILRRAVALSILAFSSHLALSQATSWGVPGTQTAVSPSVGGTSGRPGVAAANLNNVIYAAYTSNCGGNGNCPLYVTSNRSSGSATFGTPTEVYIPGIGYPTSETNPALTVASGRLYLAWTGTVYDNYLASSADGVTWSSAVRVNAGQTIYDPSLAVDPNNQGVIYLGYQAQSTYNLILCQYTVSSGAQSCQNMTSLQQMNFEPGMAFFQGTLYLGFEGRGNSHCLYFYKYTPSTNSFTFFDPTSCGQQTSYTPGLAVFNGYLYTAFRGNDGSHGFNIGADTNGTNFVNVESPGLSMDGGPSLAAIPAARELFLVYSYGGSIYASIGQPYP